MTEDAGRRPGFVVNVPLELPEAVLDDPDAVGLLRGFEDALRVAGLASVVDGEADREDWVEGALRVTSCLEAAAPHGIPVHAVRRGAGGGIDLLPLNASARDADPKGLGLVLWGLVASTVGPRLARDGHHVSDPFGGSPVYALNPGFLANAGRRFVPCRSDDEPPDGIAHLPPITEVLRGCVGRAVVHKVIDGALKEYAVERFVPTERDLMPEDVAWSVVHRSANVHSIQDDVPMAYEYRVFVVDGRVVTGAGAVMEHTPFDRLPDAGTFDPRARREIRGKGAPERPPEVVAYAARAQAIVDAMLADPSFPRHLVVDLFTNGAGEVGVVEANPLRGSGFFANDAHAVARAAVAFVLGPHHVPAQAPPEPVAEWAVDVPTGPGTAVRALWEAFHDVRGDDEPDAPKGP